MSGFEINEFKKFRKNVKNLNKHYDNFLNNFITKEGQVCLANTKSRTPVDTHRLINSWQLSGPFTKQNTKFVTVHTNVNYASWVEDGHIIKNQYGTYGFKPGVHMARIALQQTESTLQANFDKAFKDFCRGKGLM